MKKNGQIHLFIDSESKEKLKALSLEKNMPLSELIRERVKVSPQLDRIELILKSILENRGLFKVKDLK